MTTRSTASGEPGASAGGPTGTQVALGAGDRVAAWLAGRLSGVLALGGRSYVVHLLRGEVPAPQRELAARLGGRLEVRALGRDGPVLPGAPDPVDEKWAADGVALVRRALRKGGWDLVVLAGAGEAAALGLVDVDRLLELVDERPPGRALVLCGEVAPPELCEAADEVLRLGP